MISNLDIQLSNFKEKIRNNPEKVKNIIREGYSGGGIFGIADAILIFLFIVIVRTRKITMPLNGPQKI